MRAKYFIFIFLLKFLYGSSQLCSGSLGDPIVNIDFGSGTGRGAALGSNITAYTYAASGELGEGIYTIANSTSGLKGTAWHITQDHTPNDVNGYMMVINCATLASEGVFYTKSVTGLCANTTYEFSAWIMNVMKFTSPNPNVTFRVTKTDGTILGTYNTGSINVTSNPTWLQFGFYFTTGTETEVIIKILNSAGSAIPGNDLALDDIVFRPCGPTVISSLFNNNTSTINLCESNNETLILNGQIQTSGVYISPAYQWQISTDNGVTWSDIPGANTSTYSFTQNSVGIYLYRLTTSESMNISSTNCRVSSNIITVNVFDSPIEPSGISSPSECGNSTGTITITSPTGDYSYSIDGLNFQSSTVFSNLSSGSYNVFAQNNTTNCISAATVIQVNTGSGIPSNPIAFTSAPANCSDSYGTITFQTQEAYYSIDNGSTWYTSNTFYALPGNYQIKTKNNFGCESNVAIVTIPEASGFPETPTVSITQPDCNTNTGSLIVTNTENEYSIDNGNSWQNSPNFQNLTPGNYIVITRNVLGCISNSLNVIINPYVNEVPLPMAQETQLFCDYNLPTLSSIVISGNSIQWYDSNVGGQNLPSNTALVNGMTYYASQKINNCESLRIGITVTILNIGPPTGSNFQEFCSTQNPTLNLLQVNGVNIQWYATINSSVPLQLNTPLINGNQYFASQTISGCESQERIPITVSIVTPSIAINDVNDIICDPYNDSIEFIDLTSYQGSLTSEPGCTFYYFSNLQAASNEDSNYLISNPNQFEINTSYTTIYVRIESLDECFQVAKIILSLVSVPVISIPDNVTLCENSTVTLSVENTFDSYQWSNGSTTYSTTINEPGNYSITVTQIHANTTCSSTKNFTVSLSNPPVIVNIEITDWSFYNNYINIIASGLGDYEYSLDAIHWQDSNHFYGLPPGQYTVYVRDKLGCGSTFQTIYLLNYPAYFTPNGDGYNDTWGIDFSYLEKGLTTEIYDRFGKLLTKLKYNESWDGTYNGSQLPSTDYWFVVKRVNGEIKKGHFSLKR